MELLQLESLILELKNETVPNANTKDRVATIMTAIKDLATNKTIVFGTIQRQKGFGNTNQSIWEAGDKGNGFFLNGKSIENGFYTGIDCIDGNLLLQDEANWNGTITESYLNQ